MMWRPQRELTAVAGQFSEGFSRLPRENRVHAWLRACNKTPEDRSTLFSPPGSIGARPVRGPTGHGPSSRCRKGSVKRVS